MEAAATKSAHKVIAWFDGIGQEFTVNTTSNERAITIIARYLDSEGLSADEIEVVK
jgi:hypothetical protein